MYKLKINCTENTRGKIKSELKSGKKKIPGEKETYYRDPEARMQYKKRISRKPWTRESLYIKREVSKKFQAKNRKWKREIPVKSCTKKKIKKSKYEENTEPKREYGKKKNKCEKNLEQKGCQKRIYFENSKLKKNMKKRNIRRILNQKKNAKKCIWRKS